MFDFGNANDGQRKAIAAVEGTMAVFDDTIKKIMNKDFHRCADDPKVCNSCDFRFYCKNK